MVDQELKNIFHAYRPELDDEDVFMERLSEQIDAADVQQTERIGPLQRKPSAILTTIRIVSSVAAIYFVGLFSYLQIDRPAKPTTVLNNKVEKKQRAPQPAYCTEGTPREILMCYLEHRQAQPNTYKQIKQMSYEYK